jgi:hypothetical protein
MSVEGIRWRLQERKKPDCLLKRSGFEIEKAILCISGVEESAFYIQRAL